MNTLKYEYIEPNPSRQYADVNIAFTIHPVTKDVSKKLDHAAIQQSLRNLIMLNKNEKPFHPEIGGDIYNMLFDNFEEPGNEERVKYDITAIITQWEPRIELTGIDIEFFYDTYSVSISVYYVILNTLEPNNIDIFLKLVR